MKMVVPLKIKVKVILFSIQEKEILKVEERLPLKTFTPNANVISHQLIDLPLRC